MTAGELLRKAVRRSIHCRLCEHGYSEITFEEVEAVLEGHTPPSLVFIEACEEVLCLGECEVNEVLRAAYDETMLEIKLERIWDPFAPRIFF